MRNFCAVRLVRLLVVVVGALVFFAQAGVCEAQQKVVVVVGAAGQAEYGEQFKQWAEQWETVIEEANAAENASSEITLEKLGFDDDTETSDFERLKQALSESANTETKQLWIVLIGHGTYDKKAAKFNLRGPDVSAKQINKWLDALPCNIVLINCASASGPFINEIAGRNRIIVTATKSGYQFNFARFGRYLAESIGDPTIDLDKDQQTSLLEAFLAASARAQEFYVEENRLASELALIDDNGDGLGTPADWFQGTRAVQKPKKGEADGLAANQVVLFRRGDEANLSAEQIAKRNAIEKTLEQLRQRKIRLGEKAYYELIEPLMVDLAEIYEAGEKQSEEQAKEQTEDQSNEQTENQ